MSTLKDLVDDTRTDKNTRHDYLDVYHQLMSRLRSSATNVLEIGLGENNDVCNGGSMKLWLDYFDHAQVHGVEILDRSLYVNGWDKTWWNQLLSNPRLHIHFSTNAYSPDFVDTLKDKKFDVLLDDGPHTLESMIYFVQLYLPLLADNGLLIIEDIKEVSWFDILKNMIPKEYHPFVKTFDLRANRPDNPYKDDMVLVIDKQPTTQQTQTN